MINYQPVLTTVFGAQPEGDGPTLFITRGLPASGKTRWALAMVEASPGGMVRVNRDELRRGMLRADYHQPCSAEEAAVTIAQKAMVEALLLKSRSVIVDDTNLRARYVRDWLELARKTCAGAIVVDFAGVPLDVCIARDIKRDGKAYVGAEVIRGMHARFLASLHGDPLPIPELSPLCVDPYAGVVPYVPNPGSRPAVLVDLDGTTALMNGRSPYDESRVIDDLPNVPVIQVAQALAGSGLYLVFMSGRTAGCRRDTQAWLSRYVVRPSYSWDLFMRPVGDQRPDWQVKLDLFNDYVRDRFNVVCSLDDRNSVVALWRRLGITCLQVADGDF